MGVNIQNLSPLTSLLSPAFAEAASRRQAPRERRYFVGLFSRQHRKKLRPVVLEIISKVLTYFDPYRHFKILFDQAGLGRMNLTRS